MKIQILSDLHLEFYAGDVALLETLDPTDVDVLVVAGDLATVTKGRLEHALRVLCKMYPNVVYVEGNHEFYGAHPRHVLRLKRKLSRDPTIKNLHWLPELRWLTGSHKECIVDYVTINDVVFVGYTLWFRETLRAQRNEHYLNDFRFIKSFKPWVYNINRAHVHCLDRSVRPGCVVVTHHLPSYKSVAPCFANSPLNDFFVCDVEPLIASRQPALWVHGHTHTSCDYQIGKTRVVCNPYGYPHEKNPEFNPKFVVEICGTFRWCWKSVRPGTLSRSRLLPARGESAR